MNKFKDNRLGVALFLTSLIAIQIYYAISFLTKGIFVHYGYRIGTLSSAVYPVILMFLFCTLTACLILISYGFILRKSWARKFSIMIVTWTLLFPIWGLLVGNQIGEHLVFLMIYGFMLLYLTTPYVEEYFINIFKFGQWILYRKEVLLKSGKIQIIHFFAKKQPKSGVPTSLPFGYEVMVNVRSKMPYIRKIGSNPYRYGKYTLYLKVIKLKSGTELPIYFFANKKPKSGKPVSLPERFIVKVNQRSNLPYLVKQ